MTGTILWWSAKSTAAMLAAHGALEAIRDDESPWTGAGLGREVAGGEPPDAAHDAALFKTLTTPRTDVPLAETLPDPRWRGKDRALREPLAMEIEAEHLVARVPTWRAD